MKQNLDQYIIQPFSELGATIEQDLQKVKQNFETYVITPLQTVISTVQNVISWFQNLKATLMEKLENVPFVGTIVKNINSLNSAFDGVANKLTGSGTTSSGVLTDKLHEKSKRSGFATGGFPEDGLFFANHGELVGKFSNGKTAVANNEQIVAGIAAGVEDANEGVVTAIYAAATQMVNAIRDSSGGSDVDWNYVAKKITKVQKNQARALGTV